MAISHRMMVIIAFFCIMDTAVPNHICLKTTPSFITNPTCDRQETFSKGLPFTAMISASMPEINKELISS